MLDRQSDVSRIVDRLVEKNLVLRSECQRDRRKVDILISDSGIELLAEIESKLDINEPQTMALNDSEAEQLSNLLDQVRLGLTGH
jgi:DNA-binding MarR family transcriptional regulator